MFFRMCGAACGRVVIVVVVVVVVIVVVVVAVAQGAALCHVERPVMLLLCRCYTACQRLGVLVVPGCAVQNCVVPYLMVTALCGSAPLCCCTALAEVPWLFFCFRVSVMRPLAAAAFS